MLVKICLINVFLDKVFFFIFIENKKGTFTAIFYEYVSFAQRKNKRIEGYDLNY